MTTLPEERYRRRTLRTPSRIVGRLLDWTVGYGYRPWRAALWLAVMLAVGTAVFSTWRPVPDGSARTFDAVVYTMDLLVPISVFGLRDAYAGPGRCRRAMSARAVVFLAAQAVGGLAVPVDRGPMFVNPRGSRADACESRGSSAYAGERRSTHADTT